MSVTKKMIAVFFLLTFLISFGCTNVGKTPRKHHRGPKTKSSGTMNRFK